MAFHHAALFFTLLFLWFLLINAQARREPKFPKIRSSQQERLTRGAQFNFNDLQLNTARGYGKRAVDMHHVNK